MRLKGWARRFVLLLLLGATSCATLSLDQTRFAAVRKVAIVGFTVNQEEPPAIEISLTGSSKKDGMMAAPKAGPSRASAHADAMYGELRKILETSLHWKVMDRAALAASATYAKLFERTMKGLQSRPPIGANTENFVATGIIDAYPIDRMDASDRKRLMQQLGVDAIAVAHVDIALERGGGLKQLVGAGEYRPRATTRWTVYDGTAPSDDPFWKDIYARGEPSAEGTNHVFGIANTRSLDRNAIAAAESSYERLISRVRENKG